MKNCPKLKNTGIVIAHDRTFKERQEGAILRKHLKLAKEEEPNQECTIKRGALYVGEYKYTVDDLKAIEINNETNQHLDNSTIIATSPPAAINQIETNTVNRTRDFVKSYKGNSTNNPEETPTQIATQPKTNTTKESLSKEKSTYTSNYILRRTKK